MGHLEVQPGTAAQDLDGDRDLLRVRAGPGQLPGTAPPRQLLPPAQSFATRTGLNISVFLYFWSLSLKNLSLA